MRASFIHFFFNDPTTTDIYTLSLHDALPISEPVLIRHHNKFKIQFADDFSQKCQNLRQKSELFKSIDLRSEEHTSELQSRRDLVCRLLLEKKKEKYDRRMSTTDSNFATRCNH